MWDQLKEIFCINNNNNFTLLLNRYVRTCGHNRIETECRERNLRQKNKNNYTNTDTEFGSNSLNWECAFTGKNNSRIVGHLFIYLYVLSNTYSIVLLDCVHASFWMKQEDSSTQQLNNRSRNNENKQKTSNQRWFNL